MTTTVISEKKKSGGATSSSRTRGQAGGLSEGGNTTESGVWATRDSRRRPRDQRARRAPGGWGTRLEQSVVQEPMSVFGPVRAPDVRSLAGPVVDVVVPAGTELMREDVPIGTFFVIRSGSAELFRDGHQVGTLRTGDCFGEVDPECREPQGYGVVTSAPTRILTFSSFGIDRLCEAIPGARQRILDRLPQAGGEVHSLADVRIAASAASAAAAANA